MLRQAAVAFDRHTVEVRLLRLGVPGLNLRLEGTRVVFIADTHFSGEIQRVHRRVIQILEEVQAEILIFGGDAVNGPRAWPQAVEWFKKAAAAAQLMLAVAGNWDYKGQNNLETMWGFMKMAGFQPIYNAGIVYRRKGAKLRIIGLDDVKRGQPDADLAFGSEGEVHSDFTLVVSHNPDILENIRGRSWQLLLCGHTHGGQVCLPGVGALVTSTKGKRRMASGLHSVGTGKYMYVTRGVGTSFLPLRFYCPAEVVIVELHGGSETIVVPWKAGKE